MKKLFIICLLAICALGAKAQSSAAESKQYMHITTIESVVSGGLGRSKMIITNPDGSSREKDLENLFSMTGINFKNIKENETQILQTIKEFTDAGWKLDQVSPFALSPGQSSTGIFMTRYLLSKPATLK